MAQKIHEVGCKVMSNKVPSKKTPSSTNILVQSQIETQRVNTVLLSALMEVADVADLDTNAAIPMTVTKTLATEPHNSDDPHRRWISTSTTFFQARLGVAASSKTSEIGTRKLDVTLVTNDSHEWSDVKSVIDVKYHHTEALLKASKEYMVEVSWLVFTNQVHCRFFVGALLTGPEMRIALFTRGCEAFSEPINIYANLVKYMQVLSWFMHTELWYLGYDPYYQAPISTDNLSLWSMKANSTTEQDMVPSMVLSIIYSGIAGFGRTTWVMAVRGLRQQLGVDQEILIVKEDKERLQKACIKLEQEKIPYPDVIHDTEAEKKSQSVLFKRWPKPMWDDEDNEGSYPRHLPIRDQHMSTHPVMMIDCDGAQVPDSVANIMKPLSMEIYPLVHYQTVFKTNTVRCTWFSCHWEFFSGLIGALKGHLNAWLRGLIHCDTSDGIHGVPKFCGDIVESEWFPMCPGMIGDFGLALDFLDNSEKALEEKKKWTTTGTFPYSSVDREHPPNICHDLESFIFLAFMLGVNVMGPYHQLQDWPVPVHNTNAIETGISTTVDSANLTVKKFKHSNAGWATTASSELLVCSCLVPQWAKFGVSNFQDDEVIMQKENLMWDGFEHSLNPYWKGLTHTKLINVLREMINAVLVDKDGAPDKLLIMTAIMVSQTEYLPTSLPPSGTHISASSRFARFEIYTPNEMRQSLQTSESTLGLRKRKALLLQDSDSSTSATTSSVFPLSGTAGMSVNSSNLSGKGKYQRKSRG
ncbi:uncharacterized protein F5147DRAFT_777794 [Suillus discolor]|uniref:Fungal-type protein kinase domain-containing protein n=1 Tax=Suillus discolor TaxID=1912936 RepID=A0A9P7F052_9AGAM|nr:uncharacterized protein F5147DRAFT_777794 [Suillus discolor]KAG2097926.1 hypothetical protein F5147DRAFT_777794 [Suillus discolor]